MLALYVVGVLLCHSLTDAITAYSANTVIFASDKLSDIPDENFQGAVTEYLNCDPSSEFSVSIGDFETIRRCRTMEVELKKCLIPCNEPLAMECRCSQINQVTAEFVYKQCLSLSNEDTDPAKGLYSKDVSAQTAYGGSCTQSDWEGEACKSVLGASCDAPDSECRWYCAEDQASRDAFCANRMREITGTRTLAVRALKDLLQEKKRSTPLHSTDFLRATLSASLFKKALEGGEENEELILLSNLLKDDTIDWKN